MNKRIIIFCAALLGSVLGLAILITPSVAIRHYHQYTLATSSAVGQSLRLTPRVAIVFGGGVNESGAPRPVLEERLKAVLLLYEEGRIDQIVVTGDNSRPEYNEPAAMQQFLVESGVATHRISVDPAGLSTYESCERAAKIFGIREAVLVTQAGHLDRALYLCRSFGISSVGFAAPALHVEPYQLVRETFSNIKAVYNVLVSGEETKLDDPQTPLHP